MSVRSAIQHSNLNIPLVLATDLDGTFAAGSAADRSRLQRLLATRADTMLIFITGRSVPATRQLMTEAALPHPDLLIADVGTTVRRGRDFTPVSELETGIAAIWPGATIIRERLAGLEGLVEQSVRSPHRVAYTLKGYEHLANAALAPAEIDAITRASGTNFTATFTATLAAVRDRLADLPVDVIGSAGIYIDVLPRDVNKGTTLRRALRWLGRPDHQVLVAGDSMNDLALFRTGLAGVAVGNSEHELLSHVRELPNVHLATGHGAAGIAEALERFGWLQPEDAYHG